VALLYPPEVEYKLLPPEVELFPLRSQIVDQRRNFLGDVFAEEVLPELHVQIVRRFQFVLAFLDGFQVVCAEGFHMALFLPVTDVFVPVSVRMWRIEKFSGILREILYLITMDIHA
jgi:hypothetical protein